MAMKLSTEDARPDLSRIAPFPAASLAFALGLVLVFLGEQILSASPGLRACTSGLGLLTTTAVCALQWKKVFASRKEQRTTQKVLAGLTTIGWLAVALSLTLSPPVRDWLGMTRLSSTTQKDVSAVITCLWIALLLIAVLGLLFAELSLYPMRRSERVEWRRVRSAIAGGLTVGFAAIYCTLFSYSAGELNWQANFSYFRTSRPSQATFAMVQHLATPLRVIAFFPPTSEVKTEVSKYFRELQRSCPQMQFETQDRLQTPALAKEYGVVQDGVVVISRDQEQERLSIGTELKTAGPILRRLDADVQKGLMRVLRERRIVYLTVGHGELNETNSALDRTKPSATAIRDVLEAQNYLVRDIGLVQGLGNEVPQDADIVMMLGPQEPFSAPELESLERYKNRGGHLLIAVDPNRKSNPNDLTKLVGLAFQDTVLSNEQNHAIRSRNASDNVIIFSNRFSPHASVSTLSRLATRPVFFLGTGSLQKLSEAPDSLRIDFVLRSTPDTFADKNGNYAFDITAGEKRDTFNLIAAVSTLQQAVPPKTQATPQMRAVVLADADALSDEALRNPSQYNGNPQLLTDLLRWLGNEEQLAGPETSEEDVHIEHTTQKDKLWFYTIIFGAPALVLCTGIIVSRRAQPRDKAKSG